MEKLSKKEYSKTLLKELLKEYVLTDYVRLVDIKDDVNEIYRNSASPEQLKRLDDIARFKLLDKLTATDAFQDDPTLISELYALYIITIETLIDAIVESNLIKIDLDF